MNATKGKIGKGKSFFEKAFGRDENEFNELMYMPETYILFRFFFESEGITGDWKKNFKSLNPKEIIIAKEIIEKNDFKNIELLTSNNSVFDVLKHYTITRDQIADPNSDLSKLKAKFDKLDKAEKYFALESLE